MRSIFRHQFFRYSLRALLALLLLLILLGGLLGTESALRWAAQQVQSRSDGQIVVGAVHGSLYGPLRIDTLAYQAGETRIDINGLVLDWSPLALFAQRLQIDSLSLQTVRYTDTGSTPVSRPQSLHLPLALSAPQIRIEHALINSSGLEYALDNIDLGVHKPDEDYHITLRGITTPWGAGRGEIQLRDTQPFAAHGQLALQQTNGIPYRVATTVSGSLTQLLLDAQAHVLQGNADLHLRVDLFEVSPLVEARIRADGINPAALGRDFPVAKLDANISVLREDANTLSGSIALRNTVPGSWDRARLPLRELLARFDGTAGQLALHDLKLDLAGGGHFNGSGQIAGQQLQLVLSTRDFNPRGLYGTIHAMQLAGDIRLQADANHRQVTAALRDRRFQLQLDASHRDAQLELKRAVLKSAGGSLTLRGTLGMEDLQPFQLAGALQAFNPADFGDYPAARINASLAANGQLANTPQAAVTFALADNSRFRQQPLSGKGKLHVSAARIWNTDLKLQLAGNQLAAHGALGGADDRLDLRIDADKLALLAPGLSGSLSLQGALSGRFAALSGNIEAQINKLVWRDQYHIAKLQLQGRLDEGADGTLTLDAALQGIATPQLHLDHAALQVRGKRGKHHAQLNAQGAGLDLAAQLTGGWRDASGWVGQIVALTNRGRHQLALKSPAALSFTPHSVQLREARFDFAGADLSLDELDVDGGRLSSRGRLNGLPLTYLQELGELNKRLRTDLILSGKWQLNVADQVDGRLSLWRERGDISVSDQIALGINQFSLDIGATRNLLQATLAAGGSNLGHLKATAHSTLTRRDGIWGMGADTPLQAGLDLSVGTLAWLQPLLERDGITTLEGALSAQLQAKGTLAQPDLTGSISAERLDIALPDQGIRLSGGQFHAALLGQTLYLNDFAVRGGNGTLKGQGMLDFSNDATTLQIALNADKLELLSRPDRHLVLSGTSKLSAVDKKLGITAKFKVDEGLIELPSGEAPATSRDVVVLGQNEAARNAALPFSLNADLDLDLGEHFNIKGKGLNAQLGGTLKLTSVNGALPTSSGSIRVVKGAYAAYGQRLEIERGIFNFQGPIDNPSLNIIALRKNLPVEAGVAVGGTARSPRVTLTSTPSVPDSEKLSWLLLGHGLEDSDSQDFSALQVAAGALLATGESASLQQKIAHTAGLEEVSLKGAGGLENTVLTLGKRLSSRAYLSYEQGLSGIGALVKINYTLSKRLSARAQAGLVPAVDLFYTFSFN
ncbi:MAG: translocation/assembly module TamB domain-containing protein [Pseudomonadota bacterium]